MAQKLLKAKKSKVAPRKDAGADEGVVLVGTYKEKQLAWIRKNKVYNYPVGEDDELKPESCAKVKELWLYASAKAKRHCFSAEFVGIQSKDEFLAANPTYKKLGPSKHARYLVFKAKSLEYGPKLEGATVFARVSDFSGGRSKKVAKAIKQFHDGGEFGSLADYLPTELSKLSREQLRVCDPYQVDFFDVIGTCLSEAIPFPPPANPEFTFIDLFAGIGGFRLAMQSNGGKCVFSSEWNVAAQKTYEANYGDKPFGDITKDETKRQIPKGFDILCAGFPCQPFSIAGVSKKKSLGRATGFEDKTQGTLFFDVCSILKQCRPKAFLLENVKNLCSHDKGNTFRVIRESLEELDYEVFFEVIDGRHFVPQHRERILIVGFDRKCFGKGISFKFNIKKRNPAPKVADILEKKTDPRYTLSDKLWQYLQMYAEKHRAAGNGFGYGIAPLDGVTRTLSARYYKDGSEVLIEQPGKNPRRLTPRECARLMGYPDKFKIAVSDTQAYRQFGNSVVMPLMADVARLIVAKLKELEGVRHGKS